MARPRSVSNEEIIHAARLCFLEHGSQCSTTLIAAAVGLSQAAIFKRFGTKEALIKAALRPPDVTFFKEMFGEGPDDGPVEEQILGIILRFQKHLARVMPMIATLTAGKVRHKGMPKVPLLLQAHLSEWFRAGVDQGRMAGSPEMAASALMGAVQMHVFMNHFHPQSPALDAEALAGLIFKGMSL